MEGARPCPQGALVLVNTGATEDARIAPSSVIQAAQVFILRRAPSWVTRAGHKRPARVGCLRIVS